MSHEDSDKALRAALKETDVPEVLEGSTSGTALYPARYSLTLGKIICEKYSEGEKLYKIARDLNIPYPQLLKWSKDNKEFSSMLTAIRETRALHFEDMAIERAEKACGKDADRIAVDTYIWASEVNDPAVYGKRVRGGVTGDGAPVIIQVNTGWPTPPNEWQTPPKLNPDGTIDKRRPIEVPNVGVSHDRQEKAPETSVSTTEGTRGETETRAEDEA